MLDLHGNRKKRELTPAGERDENVFGIQQGVAIGVFVKRRPAGQRTDRRIRHADLWGSRPEKLQVLAGTDVEQLPGQPLQPHAPFHFFVPHSDHDQDEDAYLQWPRLDQIFQQHVSGVQTKCDALFVGYTREEVAQRMRDCLADAAQGGSPLTFPRGCRGRLQGVSFDAQHIRPYMVAPWDVRWIYYEPRLLGRARERRDASSGRRTTWRWSSCGRRPTRTHTTISWPRAPGLGSRVLQRTRGSVCCTAIGSRRDGSRVNEFLS